MYRIDFTNAFKADVKRARKRGLDIESLEKIVDDLQKGIPLEPKHRDHALGGNYTGSRECHIKPDWLLVYYILEEWLVLKRTGTHSDLFD